MKRSSPTATAATALPVYLDISVVTPIESYQDGANGQNFVICKKTVHSIIPSIIRVAELLAVIFVALYFAIYC